MDNNDLVFMAMNETLDKVEVLLREGDFLTAELLEELYQQNYKNIANEKGA